MLESRYKLCRQVIIELEFCISVLFWSLYQRTGRYITFPWIYNLFTIQTAKHCHSWWRGRCWNCVRHCWTFFFKGPMAAYSKVSSVDSVPQFFLVHFIVSGLHNSLCIIEHSFMSVDYQPWGYISNRTNLHRHSVLLCSCSIIIPPFSGFKIV